MFSTYNLKQTTQTSKEKRNRGAIQPNERIIYHERSKAERGARKLIRKMKRKRGKFKKKESSKQMRHHEGKKKN